MPWDGPVNAAVSGIHAVVAKEEKLVFAAHDELFLDFAAGIGWRRIRQVRLVKFGSVDVNGAVFQKDGIAADTDDAFDGEAFGGGIADDNDVLAGWGTKMVNPTIEEVMVRIVKGGEHAGADHFDGLDEVSADDVIAGEAKASDDQALKELPKKTIASAPWFGGGVVGGGFCGGRLGL